VKFSDHFSGVASDYAAFRPQYPGPLFDWLASVCQRHDVAWDCACGSGQASRPLASHFNFVVGTDASPTQVAAAQAAENIRFVVAASERTPLANGAFDLVTIAQALHWFLGEEFFSEVRRVVRPGGVFAAWTYGMPHIDSQPVERAVHGFIDGLLGPYWPPEIRMVLDGYASIELPFEELAAPVFELQLEWPLQRFLGFARTWSAVGRFIEEHGEDPVAKLADELTELCRGGRDLLPISYRLCLRAGRVS
jgi:SAM-dependent methyltransferase